MDTGRPGVNRAAGEPDINQNESVDQMLYSHGPQVSTDATSFKISIDAGREGVDPGVIIGRRTVPGLHPPTR